MSTPRVLREPAEFDARQVRRLRALVARAVSTGQLHTRDPDWVETTIAKGHARAVLRAQQLIGFFALRPCDDSTCGAAVYGSACLWRTSDAADEGAVHAAVIAEARRLGTALFGLRYRENQNAARFYSTERGWRVVDEARFPTALVEELRPHLANIQLLHHPLYL